MNYVFERYETKYKLSSVQYEKVKSEIEQKMRPDEFGETTVCSLYYDTDNYRLIRRSIEKPEYKEKLRVRSYGFGKDKKVFLELKKKAFGIVYKRRIVLTHVQAFSFFEKNEKLPNGQISREIEYFKNYYGNLKPAFLVMYDRTSLKGDDDLRITFDKNVRFRKERMNFWSGSDGQNLLNDGEVLMEIKTCSAYPLWLVKILNENKVYPSGFSKVGTAYIMTMSGKLDTAYDIKNNEKNLQKAV